MFNSVAKLDREATLLKLVFWSKCLTVEGEMEPFQRERGDTREDTYVTGSRNIGCLGKRILCRAPQPEACPCILGIAEVNAARPAGSNRQWEETVSEKALGGSQDFRFSGGWEVMAVGGIGS